VRAVLAAMLGALIALSWLYLAWMPGMGSTGAVYVGWMLAMWTAMGVAMMLPTALPLVALYHRFHHGRHPAADATAPTLGLVAGYLVVWTAFGALAALSQLGLEQAHLLMGRLQSPIAGGLVLAGAGAFQLSPLKAVCLDKCRSPLGFLMTRWRDGARGAVTMGMEHGLDCLGCCWALMLVMFVVGTMSLAWMTLLAAVMLAEKVAPRGLLLARITGAALVAAGGWLMLGA
jgi:predicted metal-binding membrane protein